MNPYEDKKEDTSDGKIRFKAPESDSTMVSENVEMTKRLKAFVPKISVLSGRINTGASEKEKAQTSENYKSKYQ